MKFDLKIKLSFVKFILLFLKKMRLNFIFFKSYNNLSSEENHIIRDREICMMGWLMLFFWLLFIVYTTKVS